MNIIKFNNGTNEIMEVSRLIRQHNELTDAMSALTKQECDVLGLAKWMVSKTPERLKSPTVKIDIDLYAKTLKVSRDKAGKCLRAAIETLFEKEIKFQSDNQTWGWLQSKPTIFGGGYYEITLSNRVFINLTFPTKDSNSNFTKLNLTDIAKLKKPSHVKLYELCCMTAFQKGFHLSVSELYDCFDLSDYNRTNFSYAQRKVFRPAIKAVEKLGGFKITIIPDKRGKRNTITDVCFQVDTVADSVESPDAAGGEADLDDNFMNE